MSEICHCGRPLHYTNLFTRMVVEDMVERIGPEIPVTAAGRTFLVPRHYLALHGIKARELPTLGFTEITLTSTMQGSTPS